MQAIRNDLQSRKSEVEDFLDLIKKFEDGTHLIKNDTEHFKHPVRVRITQKSCVVLMLYNVIEATITKLLIRIHDEIISEGVLYFDLNDDVKGIALSYFNSVFEKKGTFHESIPFAHGLINLLVANKAFHVPYREMEKHYSLYSGNLDSRKIVEILKKYGINFDEKASELKTIKDGRNQLSHGAFSFEEYGRDLSVQQLEAMTKNAFSYLEKVIDCVEKYIISQGYKA